MSNIIMDRKNSSLLGSLVNLFRRVLDRLFRIIFRPVTSEPIIDSFYPIRGCPGVEIEITGSNFSTDLHENAVRVGGAPAHVIEASPTRIKIITSYLTKTGLVEVEVRGRRANGPVNFQALGWPNQNLGEDGPPILYTGFGRGRSHEDMSSTGEQEVLVVLCRPADVSPPDGDELRRQIVESFEHARTYYQQVSYYRRLEDGEIRGLDLSPTVTTSWCVLDSNREQMVDRDIPLEDSYHPNIPPQAADFAAREARGDSCTQAEKEDYLARFSLIVSVIYINYDELGYHPFNPGGGTGTRYLSYHNGTDIDIDLHHPDPDEDFRWDLLWLDENLSLDWSICSHEIGHCMVNSPVEEAIEAEYGSSLGPWRWAAILGEDLYDIGNSDESAAVFDLMGRHSQAPLFSAYYMEQLGYYNADNICSISRLDPETRVLDREFTVVAHGTNQNENPDYYHLIKIQVANGLYYYIEVRQQQSDVTGLLLFDREIPLNGAMYGGGVVVTKVFASTVNMNQRMRFITLLHHPRVLVEGDVVSDPARNLRITVMSDRLEEGLLTCGVHVEWSEVSTEATCDGDLWIEQWNANYVTPDIWIDRAPFGEFDCDNPELALDPDGSKDRPRVDEMNHFYGRVHYDGPVDSEVRDVQLTFYVVTPPGVGDNGNWAPLETRGIPSISTGLFAERLTNWTPEIGEHTCLKLYASGVGPTDETLECSAQENVFEFCEGECESIPKPVVFPVAVRNPRNERIAALISVRNVPEGFVAQFPHAWVWLDPLQERRMALTIIPTYDYGEYEQREIPYANIKVSGWIPRHYREEVAPGVYPPPRLLPMGGVLVRVTPKRKVTLRIWEDQQRSRPDIAVVAGEINPAMGSEVITVEIEDPAGRWRSIKTATDDSGRFMASFNLRQSSPDAEPVELLHGVYVAQALIIISPHAAQAESNMIYLRR